MIPSNEGRISNSGTITISPKTIKQDEIQIKVSKNTPTGQSEILAPGDIATAYRDWEIVGAAITITTNKIPEGETWYIRSIQTINRTTLEAIPLENIDAIRDSILRIDGNKHLIYQKLMKKIDHLIQILQKENSKQQTKYNRPTVRVMHKNLQQRPIPKLDQHRMG